MYTKMIISAEKARAFNKAVTNPANYIEENRAIEWNLVALELGVPTNDLEYKYLRAQFELSPNDRLQEVTP